MSTASRGLIILLLALVLPVHAADHGDAPLVSIDPVADLADIYAFVNPNNPREVILAATFLPFATSSSQFSQAVLYRFHLQNTDPSSPELIITCRFPGGKKIHCSGGGIKVKGRVEQIIESGAVRLYAGLRDDPFFFDGAAFAQTVATLTPQFTDPGINSFAGANVLAIVMGIDASVLLASGEGSVLKYYVSTARRRPVDDGGDDDDDGNDDDDGDDDADDDDADDDDDDRDFRRASRAPAQLRGLRQIDRTGRPGITTALIDLLASTGLKDRYNQSADISMWSGLFEKEIAGNLAALDTLDGITGNNLLPPMVLASVLVDDRLIIDVRSPDCDAYLAVELGLPQCGGRTLERDVIDDTFGAVVGPGVSDFVDNDSAFLSTFPFLGEPN
ncbi:MAG: DUF4331 family protein [Gammaproteobacteria bacterium]|nr:DUF4331 family protein [Gammaproteobacteria bacterium]